jgi:hypothetical protein
MKKAFLIFSIIIPVFCCGVWIAFENGIKSRNISNSQSLQTRDNSHTVQKLVEEAKADVAKNGSSEKLQNYKMIGEKNSQNPIEDKKQPK